MEKKDNAEKTQKKNSFWRRFTGIFSEKEVKKTSQQENKKPGNSPQQNQHVNGQNNPGKLRRSLWVIICLLFIMLVIGSVIGTLVLVKEYSEDKEVVTTAANFIVAPSTVTTTSPPVTVTAPPITTTAPAVTTTVPPVILIPPTVTLTVTSTPLTVTAPPITTIPATIVNSNPANFLASVYTGNFVNFVGSFYGTNIQYDWSMVGPLGLSSNYSVCWEGDIYLRIPGNHNFQVATDGKIRMDLSGDLLFNSWQAQSAGTVLAQSRYFNKGYYHLKVEYFHMIGPAYIQVYWD